MTKKIKVLLLAIFSALCLSCALAGCVGVPDFGEITAGYDSYIIEYYANGGKFGSATSTTSVSSIYIKGNSSSDTIPFYETNDEANEENTSMMVLYTGYDFVGWFLPETYETGDHAGEFHYTYTYEEDGQSKTVDVFKVKDKNGDDLTDSTYDRPVFARAGMEETERILESSVTLVATETEVTKAYRVEKNTKLTVCAVWRPSLKIVYKLACEEGKTYKDTKSNREFKNGEVLYETNFGNGVTGQPMDIAPRTLAGATFIATYTSPDFAEVANLLDRPSDDDYDPATYDPEKKHIFVYCRYLDGADWTVVKNDSSSVKNMFSQLGTGKKYFLLSDVDCSSVTIDLKRDTQEANATILSDGVTLKNLKFARADVVKNNLSLSPFGSIGDEFSISNVTIENLTIEKVTGSQSFSLFAISSSVSNKAKFDKFAITGTITAEAQVSNGLYNAVGENRDSWLFGTGVSDSAYLAANDGKINVTDDRTLTVIN